jgi:hypothetical protein
MDIAKKICTSMSRNIFSARVFIFLRVVMAVKRLRFFGWFFYPFSCLKRTSHWCVRSFTYFKFSAISQDDKVWTCSNSAPVAFC